MKKALTSSMHAKGAFFIGISAFFYASYGVWSKFMMDFFAEFNQAWIRALMILIVLVPFGIITKSFKKIQKADWKWFLVMSLAGGFNQAPIFYGFKHLPVGTATLLFFTMLTIGSYIIGKVFFNENLTRIKYFSLGLALIGLSIIYTFSLTADQILPAIFISLAGFMGACVVVFSKKVSSKYSEIQILTSLFVVMLLVNVVVSRVLGESIPLAEVSRAWFAQVGYAIAMLIANGAVVVGFRYLEPSIGGIIGLLEVVFGVLFGIIVFHEPLTAQLLVGSMLIILSAGLSDSIALIKDKSKINLLSRVS
ncbi:hypothetical protein A3D06_00815 [Candidatus Roizmanbacteria bacterium RIFCSPHIGHO2_02_FULL_40_9]|uniref:EamA domain-containing protein n=2 Tax=Candidatus Roizmaniibacteriota TaxID=1752723 RepID=A0A1F7IM41_9BACT|nr:MAG: hypothetical protein A3D06_00815 [Candidatus Roizmanbacteria bacterium RIFCSPHIGHO2_02_FULL_40_9]OGK44392.1 MAG: hypothetical protein A2957_00835 [Candidatus Roizmanbacteria bacterium RIFCSPLOWO2_01_FULL_38_11]